MEDLPAVTAFRGVYPNPFNPTATIAFDLAAAENVQVTVYNLSGALVRTLVREARPISSRKTVRQTTERRTSRKVVPA